MANEFKNRKQKNNAPIFWVLGVVLGIGALFGLIVFLDKQANKSVVSEYEEIMKEYPNKKVEDLNQATIDSFKDDNYNLVMSPKKIDEKIKNKEDVFIYFYSPTCVHCQAYTPTLMSYLNENPDIDNVHFLNILEYPEYWQKYTIEGTPTMVHFKSGKEKNRFAGELSSDETKAFFDLETK